jgi:hypothetical protein
MKNITTVNRVSRITAQEVNDRIERAMQTRLHYYAAHPEEIAARLEELDREWDIERRIEAGAPTVALAGTALGLTVSRKFLAIPLIVAGFLLMHAVHGFAPPVPVMRRLGVRTQSEIERERYALKALRGDFRNFSLNGREKEPTTGAGINEGPE